MALQGRLGETQVGILHREQFLVLLNQGIFRFGQHSHQSAFHPAA